MIKKIGYLLVVIVATYTLNGCHKTEKEKQDKIPSDSIAPIVHKKSLKEYIINLEKDFLFTKYGLEDVYPYKDTTRRFQWDVIKDKLAYLEFEEDGGAEWGVITNYKNINGESPLVYKFKRNAYTLVCDTFGVERYQSAPLYALDDTVKPVRYGTDGSIVKILSNPNDRFVKIEGVSFQGFWYVPRKYINAIGDSIYFKKVVVVDITNQNICTLENSDSTWLIRSMNPATTGKRNPPYGYATPTGMFLLQQKKNKMYYYKDGTTDIQGYAPYASRFTRGAHIHGVPTNHREAPIIEYSWTLGTTPRSHMCVRNATSHAQFIYEWAPINKTVVFVIK